MFKKELEKDVAGDTSGDFAKLLLALVQVRLSCCIGVPPLTSICLWYVSHYMSVIPKWFLNSRQAKRADRSAVVDYEKIDEDARVSSIHLWTFPVRHTNHIFTSAKINESSDISHCFMIRVVCETSVNYSVSPGSLWRWGQKERNRCGILDLYHVWEKCSPPTERYLNIIILCTFQVIDEVWYYT